MWTQAALPQRQTSSQAINSNINIIGKSFHLSAEYEMFTDRNVELNAGEFHYKRQRYIHNNEKKSSIQWGLGANSTNP